MSAFFASLNNLIFFYYYILVFIQWFVASLVKMADCVQEIIDALVQKDTEGAGAINQSNLRNAESLA